MDALNNTTGETVQMIQPHSIIATLRYSTAVLAIILNGGIALAYLVQKVRRPTSVRLSPTGLLVLNFLIADTLLGGVILFNVAAASTILDTNTTWCIARISISFLATIAPHTALLNVVIDRFRAIVHHLEHRECMSWRRSVIMLCCGWFIPVAGAVALVIAADGPHNMYVPSCSDIHGYKVFLWSVWIPAHIIANVTVIIVQCRVYSFLKRHDRERVNSNQVHSSSFKFEWILFRITMPTYMAMLAMYVMKIIVKVTGDPITSSVYQVTLLVVQIWYLLNPLVYVYATANIRRPVSDLFKDIRSCFCPAKEPLKPCV